MLLTLRRLMPVVKSSNGQSRWIEQSEKFLPKGGKKMDLGLKFIATIFGGALVVTYFTVQADINPESIYGRVYKIATVQGIGYFFNTHIADENAGLQSFNPDKVKPLHS
uniref:Prohibitin n=1 Tax=Panagrellus redivivus TaxID=6233 RepID=A0A7E4W7P3_PANRE